MLHKFSIVIGLPSRAAYTACTGFGNFDTFGGVAISTDSMENKTDTNAEDLHYDHLILHYDDFRTLKLKMPSSHSFKQCACIRCGVYVYFGWMACTSYGHSFVQAASANYDFGRALKNSHANQFCKGALLLYTTDSHEHASMHDESHNLKMHFLYTTASHEHFSMHD